MTEATRAAKLWASIEKDPTHRQMGIDIFTHWDAGELRTRHDEADDQEQGFDTSHIPSLTRIPAKLLEKLGNFIEAYETKIQPDGQGSEMKDTLLRDIREELASRSWLN